VLTKEEAAAAPLAQRDRRRRVRLRLAGFWDRFDEQNNWFTRLLQERFDLAFESRPDFLLYSSFSAEYQRYRCTRIFYTGENVRPDFSQCDFAFTFDHLDDPRHYRLPLYRLYFEDSQLTQVREVDAIVREKRKFCNMVVSNPQADERIGFFQRLSRHRAVDSGGKVLNNVGGPVPDKLAFIRNYKFTLAFENACYPGYTTEKLVQPWVEGSVPIYWGNPRVAEEFNQRSFINVNDFPDWNAAIRYILRVDQDEQIYRSHLQAPLFRDGQLPEFLRRDRILDRFEEIFLGKVAKRPVATRRQQWRYAVGKLRRRIRNRVRKRT